MPVVRPAQTESLLPVMKPLVIVLSIVCLALAAQIWLRQGPGNRAHQEIATLGNTVNSLSNEVRTTRLQASEEARLAAYLQSNLTAKAEELASSSNRLNETIAALESAQLALQSARSETERRSGRIAELEGRNASTQLKLEELASSIGKRNLQIAEATRKLAAAEGDRDSLARELATLRADKAELLRQFNDIAALKAQLALLRDEAAVNQRLSWKSQGVYQNASRKGAEALVARQAAPALAGNPSLDVEVREKGMPVDEPARALPAK